MADLLTALVTPFTQEKTLDFSSLNALLDHQIKSEVSGLVVLGTTGEAELMNFQEKIHLLDYVFSYINDQLPITVGCGKSSTIEMLQFIDACSKYPIKQFMVVTPPYIRPSAQGLYAHYKALSQEKIPFIVYLHPGRTGCQPSLNVLEDILNLPHCLGLKDASGGCQVMLKLAPKYKIYSGDDALLLPHLSLGAQGVISVASNLIPEAVKKILDLFPIDPKKALGIFSQIQSLIEALFIDPNPQGIKGALSLCGVISNHLKLPYLPSSEEVISEIEKHIWALEPNLIGLRPSSIKA